MKIKHLLKTIGLITAFSFSSMALISCDDDFSDLSDLDNTTSSAISAPTSINDRVYKFDIKSGTDSFKEKGTDLLLVYGGDRYIGGTTKYRLLPVSGDLAYSYSNNVAILELYDDDSDNETTYRLTYKTDFSGDFTAGTPQGGTQTGTFTEE